jgi:hypothetical protein
MIFGRSPGLRDSRDKSVFRCSGEVAQQPVGLRIHDARFGGVLVETILPRRACAARVGRLHERPRRISQVAAGVAAGARL